METSEQINSRNDTEDLVVYSSDYDNMYPSLEIDEVAKIAAEEFLNSRLEVDIDWVELSLYLAVTFTRQELVDMGLGDVTHTRVSSRGRAPGITTKEILIGAKILHQNSTYQKKIHPNNNRGKCLL